MPQSIEYYSKILPDGSWYNIPVKLIDNEGHVVSLLPPGVDNPLDMLPPDARNAPAMQQYPGNTTH